MHGRKRVTSDGAYVGILLRRRFWDSAAGLPVITNYAEMPNFSYSIYFTLISLILFLVLDWPDPKRILLRHEPSVL